jgi:hypothetical protein
MIEQFISTIKQQGLSRTNRYAVTLTPPVTVDNANLNTILLLCDQVSLPGINYATVQNRTFGEFREVPYEKLFDTVSMSFYVDQGLQVKFLFDKWMSFIQDPKSRRFNYYKNYISPMEIVVQDLMNKSRYSVQLYECYPKNVGAVQMDYASRDVMKLQVTMQYKWWESSILKTLDNGQIITEKTVSDYTTNFNNFQENQYSYNLGNSSFGSQYDSYSQQILPDTNESQITET